MVAKTRIGEWFVRWMLTVEPPDTVQRCVQVTSITLRFGPTALTSTG